MPQRDELTEQPPFLGTWRRVYIAVALSLVAVIALLAWFTRTFNR